MSRPARLGLIALAFAVVVSLGTYFGTKYIRGGGGYQMGVHFRGAAGIVPGSLVYFNGVNIGNVSKVQILPDTTVEVILNIFHATDIPKHSKFSVQSKFTGSSAIYIATPVQQVAQNQAPTPLPRSELLPKRVLPIEQQPMGSEPLTIEDVMHQGLALGSRASRILAQARPYGARLRASLSGARANGAAAAQEMRSAFPAILATLQSTARQAKANIANAQTVLQKRDQRKLAAVAQAFQKSAHDMKTVTDDLASIKSDPRTRANVREAAAQLRATASTMKGLSRDMEMISGSAQTKAELRDAGARFRDIIARLKSLI